MSFQREFAELKRWRSATDAGLTVIALGSLPLLLLHFIGDRLSNNDKLFLYVVDVVVFLAFFIDFVVEVCLVRDKPSYFKAEWLNLIIVLAQLAALLPALGALGAFRAARGLRVATTAARIIGIGVASSRQQGLETLRTNAARLAFGMAGMTWITSAVAFTLAEDVGNGRRIESIFDSLWWSAATITTVGYGDIYPVTAIGRVIAVFTMVVGISTLAVVTARVAAFLVKDGNEK